MRKHVKIPGFVEHVSPDRKRWSARLSTPSGDVWADMAVPIDPEAVPGSFFTIHRTKNGYTYIYWIKTRWTKREVKKSRIRGRELATRLRALGFD